MENAVNIMAMVQSNSIVKKKFDVPSKTLGNDKTSFRKELNQARKDITKDYSIDTKDVEEKTQSTTEKKIEKFAKVMSNNNAKAEVKAEVKTEANAEVKTEVKTEAKTEVKTEVKAEVEAEVQVKPSVEALEQTDAAALKSNLEVADVKQLEQTEEDVKTEEPIQSVLDMLQQLIEMIQGQKIEGASNQQLTELKTKFQEVFQGLEQTLKMAMTSQVGEVSKLISNLKNDLSELVAQLEIVPEYELDSKKTEQLINQLSDKLNQAKTQIKQVYQILQPAVKPMDNSEVSQLHSILAVKTESKEITTDSAIKVVETTDENQQIQKADTDKATDNKDNKDSNESAYKDSDENTYKANENKNVLQAVSGDKLNQTDLNEIVAPQVEKDNFQLNIKQANANLQKESLVKFNKSDIINQVIKKADLFVQGSHQEMVMKLEPESLGKLNLKIVVENGLITAKFVAESQQVKEVLESSFNQLKNALQEKGIAVQGFSVSVGQQGAAFNSGQGFEQWKRTIKMNNKASGGYMGLDEENSMSINPYSYHEGKVDYRA